MRHCHLTSCYSCKHCFLEHIIMGVLKSLLKPVIRALYRQFLLLALFFWYMGHTFLFHYMPHNFFFKNWTFLEIYCVGSGCWFPPASRACFFVLFLLVYLFIDLVLLFYCMLSPPPLPLSNKKPPVSLLRACAVVTRLEWAGLHLSRLVLVSRPPVRLHFLLSLLLFTVLWSIKWPPVWTN